MTHGAHKLKLRAQSIRQAAETQIERLIALLDSLDGDTDFEPSLAGYSHGMDDREGDEADGPEDDPSESGVADMDGYMEQCPKHFQHCTQRVE